MSEFATPFDCYKAYEDGIPGWQFNARANADFMETQKYQYFSEPNIKGSGIGKRALLWQYAKKLDKNCFTERQTTGDCFVAGTLVRMGDGTEKAIEDVLIGDIVASPFGGKRRVLSTFNKPYTGSVFSVRAEGCLDAVVSTPDHLFVSPLNESERAWVRADALAKGSRVFLPATSIASEHLHTIDLANEDGCSQDPNEFAQVASRPRRIRAGDGKVRISGARYECNRHVTLDADMAWVIGLWLAEGSTGKSKRGAATNLVWNLCRDEVHIAKCLRSILQDKLGVPAKIRTLPSKPNCLFVEFPCAPFARWIYRACGEGNTYTKRAPKEILVSPSAVRLACVRGWMEGDGHVENGLRHKSKYKMCRASGVSVCRGLVRDMKYLSMSCGIRCTEVARKPRGRSKVASEVHFYGDSAAALFPAKLRPPALEGGRRSLTVKVDGGFSARVSSVEVSPFAGTVYCLEVECDHAFIANGYAVHNCVSHGSRNARDTTRAVEILVKKEPEDWFRMGATEPTYGARGHGGQGMSPGVASKFERDTGFLARTNYDGVVDLTKYNSAIGARWGSSGVPDAVKELCRKNRVGVITQVRSQEDLMDAMWNGYAAHSGQNASWSVDSNDKGIHYRTSRGWNHDMAICFYDDTREFFPFRVWGIVNSWGEWNQKPKAWPKEYGEWVPGMILTSADDFNVCVADGDCWVYGSIDGYPPQRLPDYGTVGLLRHG